MASRGTWNLDKWSGSQWVAETAMYRPNENLSIDRLSTQTKVVLADGSVSFITPETKFAREPLTMQFLLIDNSDGFWGRMEDYVENNDYLRITDHLGNFITGKFISIKRVWLAGVDDQYDLEIVFEVII